MSANQEIENENEKIMRIEESGRIKGLQSYSDFLNEERKLQRYLESYNKNHEVPHKRLLTRPNLTSEEKEIDKQLKNKEEQSSVNKPSNRTPTPEKCRLENYQKRPLSYKEIKNKITNITFLPDGKKKIAPEYLQKMLEMSTKRRFGAEAKYPNEKYCDVVKNKPSYIAWLLQNTDCIVPEQLRDYCFISVHERHFK